MVVSSQQRLQRDAVGPALRASADAWGQANIKPMDAPHSGDSHGLWQLPRIRRPAILPVHRSRYREGGKMLKRLLSWALACAAMLSITGCAVNRATASLMPDADLSKVKSVYVVKLRAPAPTIS